MVAIRSVVPPWPSMTGNKVHKSSFNGIVRLWSGSCSSQHFAATESLSITRHSAPPRSSRHRHQLERFWRTVPASAIKGTDQYIILWFTSSEDTRLTHGLSVRSSYLRGGRCQVAISEATCSVFSTGRGSITPIS
jgi:hypothetical protein